MRALAVIALVACSAPAPTPPPKTPITNEVPRVDQLECSSAPIGSAITLVAVRGTRREDICRGIAVTAGKPLDEALVDADIRSLYKTALFEDVTAFVEGTTFGYELRERPKLLRIDIVNPPPGVQLPKQDFGLAEPVAIRRGAAQIRDALHEAGYRTAKVEHAVAPSGSGVALQYTITAGTRTVLDKVKFQGIHAKREALVSKGVLARAGEPLTDLIAEREIVNVQTALYEEGLLTSRVSYNVVDASASTVDLVIEIVEGPVFKLGAMKVKGPRARDPKAYAKALAPLKKGDIARRSKLAGAIKAIEAIHAGDLPAVNVYPQSNVQSDKKLVDMDFVVE
jgi:outer membrane protein assembly factor BamA